MDGGEPLLERRMTDARGVAYLRRRRWRCDRQAVRRGCAALAQSVGGPDARRRPGVVEIADRLLELGIVGREGERRPVLAERLGECAPLMDLGEPRMAARFSGALVEDRLELALRRIELAELEERAAERDAGREIAGMDGQAGAADVDRLLNCPARRYSSASCANAIDAGSFWTRRRRSSIRGLSAIAIYGCYGRP